MNGMRKSRCAKVQLGGWHCGSLGVLISMRVGEEGAGTHPEDLERELETILTELGLRYGLRRAVFFENKKRQRLPMSEE